MLSTLAKGAIVAFVLQLLGVAATYISQIFLARWLGTTEYGIYEYVLTCALLLAILAALGLPGAVLRLIPEYRVKQEIGQLRGVLASSLPIVFGAGLIIAAISSGLILQLERLQNWSYAQPLLVGIWLVPLLSAIELQSEMARTVQRIVLARAPKQVFWPIATVLGAWLILQIRTPLNSITLLGLSILILAVIFGLQYWRLDRIFRPETERVKPIYQFKVWFGVALPLLLGNGFFIVLSYTDVLMLGTWIDPAAVGMYSVAAKTSIWVRFVLQAVNTVVAPMFSELYAQGDRHALQALVSKTARWMFFPTIFAAILVIVNSEWILGLFGPEFVAARGQTIVLVGGSCVNALSGSVGYLMAMTGHQTQSSKVLGYSALVNLVLNVILIPKFAGLGAAIATATAMAMWNIWLYVLVVKNIGIHASAVVTFFKKEL
ncbi:MAG: oligosaccharide flippase family protein [Cyanobacteriota bacterium]|nr:oligosaccharide flippase family protein [Cyanobacteriota bacterium]